MHPEPSHDFKKFALKRDIDVTGKSGTGIVAWGVVFPDGRTVTRWDAEIAQTCTWDSIEDVISVHGHDGKTKIIWLD